ncbi:MAG: EAL domain-containing protein, partial [Chloroflexi bacterium]|nr:EAL domain-containing protein [Chloroflexota bacterium]
MPWLVIAYILTLFLGAAVAPGLALFAWRRRPAAGMTPLTLWMVGVGIWCLCYLMYLLSSDPSARLFWFHAKHLGSTVMAPTGLVFALQFSGQGRRVTPVLLALLALEVVATWSMVATNHLHHLYWSVLETGPDGAFPVLITELGPWARGRLLYSNVMQAGAMVVIMWWLPRSSPLYRHQAVLLLAATAFPWTASLLTNTGMNPFGRLDLTPGGFAVTALLWAWAIVRHGVLDIVPVARYAAIEGMRDAVFTINTAGQVVDINPAAQRLLGIETPPLLGLPVEDVFEAWPGLLARLAPGAPDSSELEMTLAVQGEPGPRTFEFRIAAWRDAQGRPLGRLVLAYDVSARKTAEEALERQALYDALTGLPNRTLLHRRLDEALRRSEDSGAVTALLVMDLNGFKDINDTFGHQVGDGLLQQAARRVQSVVRSGDTAARLGGDEFAVVLPGAGGVESAGMVAQRILALLETPFVVDQTPMAISASIGIALAPHHSSEGRALLRQADIAMYSAKRSGGGYAVFNPAADPRNPAQLALLAELRKAIASGDLVLHYQPQIRVDSGELIGVEALVRWRHPERGLLLPEQFLPLAERSGLIQPLSRWVLATALQQASEWRQEGLDLALAVNLSIANLWNERLPSDLAQAIQTWEVVASRLTLELSETLVMADPDLAQDVLKQLRRLGVRVALDDFGMGQSSLAWLHRLSVDEIKIDKSFMAALKTDENAAAIVRMAVETGHHFGLQVVAEGVDRPDTLHLLASLGCDAA